MLLGLVVFFSFPSFLSCRRTGSVIFLSLLLLLLLCLFFGFGLLSFISSSLSKPGLLFAMNVSKETRTCLLVNSTPHLLAAPSTWLMPSSSPPALKIPRSLSLSSKSLERPFEVFGRVDSNTAAFCGQWNTVIVCFLTSEVVFFFFGSSSTEVFFLFQLHSRLLLPQLDLVN